MNGEFEQLQRERAAEIEQQYEAALAAPEPVVQLTGRRINVEWEEESGARTWERMDEGELDRAIWLAHRRRAGLSDIEE